MTITIILYPILLIIIFNKTLTQHIPQHQNIGVKGVVWLFPIYLFSQIVRDLVNMFTFIN